MATITLKRDMNAAQFGGPAYGNLSALPFQLKTNASGIAIGGDAAAAIGNGDVVRLGTLPAGASLIDFTAYVSTTFSATTTCKIGFAYVDAVDDALVPQNDAYFVGAGQALSSLAVVRKTATTAPLRLPKDAYLILTNAGAAQAKAAQLDAFVFAELGGK